MALALNNLQRVYMLLNKETKPLNCGERQTANADTRNSQEVNNNRSQRYLDTDQVIVRPMIIAQNEEFFRKRI